MLCVTVLQLWAQNDEQSSWVDSLSTPLPDNVYRLSCIIPSDSAVFALQEHQSSEIGYAVHGMSTPMVADLDGDGVTEIIACGVNSSNSWYGQNLLVFNGVTGQYIRTILTNNYWLQGQSITIGDVNNDGHAEIFVLDHIGYLTAYNYDGTNYWTNSQNNVPYNYLLSVADIMGDGNVELVCGSFIFNALNGNLLLSGTMQNTGRGFGSPNGNDLNSNPYYMYALADIDGDSTLELCAGNSIYKLNITNYAGVVGNSWQLLRQAESIPEIDNYDGQTFILDFDGDGNIDIGVIGTTSTLGSGSATGAAVHTVNPYVWDCSTGEIIAYTSINNNNATHRNYAPSIPAVADIDHNGTSEIIFGWKEVGLVRITYDNTATGNMRKMARLTSLGSTAGVTVFDFNSDGRNEIVVRGNGIMRVIDGETLEPLCPSVISYSNAIAEYPVVADVDGDGEAEIIIAAANSQWNASNPNPNGRIRVYGSSSEKWNTARGVWNQWAYSSVNINENLTVPRYRFNVATRFPNNTQSFNYFLCQMPYLDTNGNTFKPMADAKVLSMSADLYNQSMDFHVGIANEGSATLAAPYAIAVYKGSYRGLLIYADTVYQPLLHDSAIVHNMSIDRMTLCALEKDDSIVIAINDFGDGVAHHGGCQEECDTLNNFYYYAAPFYSSKKDTVVTACDSLDWLDGVKYTASQQSVAFNVEGGNSVGCDSTLMLNLTVNYSSVRDTSLTECDSVVWHEFVWKVPQVAIFSTQDVHGCDSTLLLSLNVKYSTSYDTIVSVCDSLNWYETTYTESGTPAYHMTNFAGCDSTITIHLTVNSSLHVDTTVFACESYQFFDSLFTESVPNYENNLVTTAGCDSSMKLSLTIGHNNTGGETLFACDSLTWTDGVTYTESTDTPIHHFTNIQGCDSAVTLNLTIANTVHILVDTAVCDLFVWNDMMLTGDTMMGDTVTRPGMCDSITLLVLDVGYSSIVDTIVMACDSFTWYGTTYTSTTNTPIRQLTNAQGCDSTVALNLTVNYSSAIDTAVISCDSFLWHGITYTNSTDPLIHQSTNMQGCDSTETLHLTVNHSSTGDTVAAACGSFTWYGTTYTNSTNTPTHQSTNIQGCDSTVTLLLTINSCSKVTDTACESYLWNGVEYNATGIYTYGSDTLNLTIGHHYSGDTTVYACDGYTWCDSNYYESGNYSFFSSTTLGCDSLLTIHLFVSHVAEGDTAATVCDSMTWYGTVLHEDGEYQHLTTSMTPAHCDSVVTLHLDVIKSTMNDIVDSLCAGSTYSFAGNEIYSGGLYYDTLISADGCDSIIRLMLTSLTPPTVTIDHDYDCLSRMHFLTAVSNVDHVCWSSSGGWPSEWGSPNSHTTAVSVDRSVVVTLTADYNSYQTCPQSSSIVLNPIIMPQARMHVTPEFLTGENLKLSAVSRSHDAEWLQWFVDGSEAGSTERIEYIASPGADSVVVALVASSQLCVDTAEQTVYVRRSSIFAPNAFTPDEATNRTFSIFCNGVIEYELRIYTRQGILVCQSVMGDEPWDGTKNGKPCPQGGYVWVARYRSVSDPLNWHYEKGTVMLMR